MHLLLILLALFVPSAVVAAEEKPRLVVMLVFDQMRGDYLTRWEGLFAEGGFKRLTGDGAWYVNCHYPYAYTMTGPGHATISTGCPPMTHGIVGNEWYDRKEAKAVNCVGSDRHSQIPPPPPPKDKKKHDLKGVSPARLLAPTFADALKDQLGEDARVVAVSLKDRSSVLPGGKRPDACYWADKNGQFVTSNYYRDAVHGWVKEFNKEKFVDQWHGKQWLRLRPDLDYEKYSGPDDGKGENKGSHQGYTFPHPFTDGPKKDRANYYAAVAASPFGNDVLLALAKKAVVAEKLGSRDKPDFLSISFSSNDLVGHAWGADSQEVLDVTLRSDLIVKELLTFLDEKVGKDKYVVAMTADHGICPLPEVSRSKGLEARRVDLNKMLRAGEEHLDQTFSVGSGGPDEKKDAGKKEDANKPRESKKGEFKGKWLTTHKSLMLYFNQKYLASRGVTTEHAARVLARWMARQPGIATAYTRADLLRDDLPDEVARMTRRSFFPERSGDVMLIVERYCLLTSTLTGTTHGTPWEYDTHVPLVAMGPGIKPGVRKERVSPEHMALILSRAAGVKPPTKAAKALPQGLFAE